MLSKQVLSTLRNPPQRVYQVQLPGGLVRPYTEAMIRRMEIRTGKRFEDIEGVRVLGDNESVSVSDYWNCADVRTE